MNQYESGQNEPRKRQLPAMMVFSRPLWGRLPVQEVRMLELLLEKFGNVPTPVDQVQDFIREAMRPHTKQPDPWVIFLYYRKHLKELNALSEQTMETYEQVREKYDHATVKIFDDLGQCQCSGTVTEVYKYDDLIILAVKDDEQFAWAMAWRGQDVVQHYDREYKIQIVEGEV